MIENITKPENFKSGQTNHFVPEHAGLPYTGPPITAMGVGGEGVVGWHTFSSFADPVGSLCDFSDPTEFVKITVSK